MRFAEGGGPRGAGEAGQRTGRASRSRRITHRRFGAGCPKSNLISGRLRRRLPLVSQAVRAVAPSFLSVSSPSTPHSSPRLVSLCPYEGRQATCEARYRRPIRPRDLCKTGLQPLQETASSVFSFPHIPPLISSSLLRKSKCDGRAPVCGPCEKAGRASEVRSVLGCSNPTLIVPFQPPRSSCYCCVDLGTSTDSCSLLALSCFLCSLLAPLAYSSGLSVAHSAPGARKLQRKRGHNSTSSPSKTTSALSRQR